MAVEELEEIMLEETPTTQLQEGEGGEDTPAETAPLSGRAAFIERFRGYHPDLEGDPDDDSMFDYAGQGLTERDELKGKYDTLNGSNERLAEAVSRDPRVAQFIAMIGAGQNPMFALGKSFGNIINELDEESLKKLQEGQAEYEARVKRIRDNFQLYEETLKIYIVDNGLTEEQGAEINDVIIEIADALSEGNIPYEMIDNVWKGLDFDNEKAAELEAAKLAAKNETITEIKDKKGGGGTMPDVVNRRAPKPAPAVQNPAPEQTGYVDVLADSVKIK